MHLFLFVQAKAYSAGSVFSYKLQYIVGFWLVDTGVSTNQNPTMYHNLYENTGPDIFFYKPWPHDQRVFFNLKSSKMS